MTIKIWNLTLLLTLFGWKVAAQLAFGSYKFMGPMNIPNLPLLYWDDAKNWQVYERDLTSKIPNAGRWVAATKAPTGSEPQISLQCGGQKVTLRKNTTLNLTSNLVSGWGNVSAEPNIAFEENATLNVNKGALIDAFMLTGTGKVNINEGSSTKNKLTFKEAMQITIAANAQLKNPIFSLSGNCSLTNNGTILNEKQAPVALFGTSKWINVGTITGIVYVTGETNSIFENKGSIHTQTIGCFFMVGGKLMNSGQLTVLTLPSSLAALGYSNMLGAQVVINTGRFTIGNNVAFVGSFSNEFQNSGELILGSNASLKAKSMEINGHLQNDGILTTVSDLTFKNTTSLPQEIRGNGRLQGTARIVFDNPKGITISGKQECVKSITITTNSIVNILPSSHLTSTNGTFLIQGTLNNQGMLETSYQVQMQINGAFNNQGTFKSATALTGNGKLTNQGNCTITSNSGVSTPIICQTNGSLSAEGTVTLGCNFAGLLQINRAPKVLTVHNVNGGGGEFRFNGTMVIDLNGKKPYSALLNDNYHSVIHFKTHVSFSNAVLQVKLGNNFVPAKGDVFKIITYQPQMGMPGIAAPPQTSFLRMDLPPLPATLKWERQYNTPTDFTLKVVQK